MTLTTLETLEFTALDTRIDDSLLEQPYEIEPRDVLPIIVTLGQLCQHGCLEETGCKQFNDCPRK